MSNTVIYIIFGLSAGMASGIIGIGGGVLLIPAMVYILGFTQKTAQGTTLALMVPPIGLLAAWQYYANGHVEVKAAAIIALTFFGGAYFGSKIGVALPQATLKKIFGFAMLLISIKMIFGK